MFPDPHDHLQLSRAEIMIPALLEACGEFELLQLLLQAGPLERCDAF
jgi:hypothetical protein